MTLTVHGDLTKKKIKTFIIFIFLFFYLKFSLRLDFD